MNIAAGPSVDVSLQLDSGDAKPERLQTYRTVHKRLVQQCQSPDATRALDKALVGLHGFAMRGLVDLEGRELAEPFGVAWARVFHG